jgi:pimeloyl-ACP methyl ester carboxylesterase
VGRLNTAVAVDVSAEVPLPGEHTVRGRLISPATPSESVVWCCLPGGGCSAGYFDLVVDDDDTTYSMAAYLADAGYAVLILDHLGSGASSRVDDDFLLTPEIVADANQAAFSTLLDQLRTGTLVPELASLDSLRPIGLGHSMGAMLTIVQQARHGTYSAVVNLGSGGDGLPEYLRDPTWVTADVSWVRASLAELARVQADGPRPEGGRPVIFHTEDVPATVLTAFRGQTTKLLPTCGLVTLIPGGTDAERGALSVPLFLGFGEHDLSEDARATVGRYRSCPDITLVVLAGSGHCHNQAANRHQLWQRLLAWARTVPLGDAGGAGAWGGATTEVGR